MWEEIHERTLLGTGPGVFRRASDALLSWRLHEAAGVRASPAPDGTATLKFRLFPVPAPVRIVEATRGADDQPGSETRLVYEALPGHPEEGLETFTVRIDADGAVWCEVQARSRPARWYSRLGHPAARALQLHITRRYLQAARTTAGA